MISARGGVEFRVNGEKIVKESEAFLLTHPVNSYYTTDDYDDNPIIKYGGDWKRIEAGRVLWTTTTDGEGGSLVEAGLPNITGELHSRSYGQGYSGAITKGTGAFSYKTSGSSVSTDNAETGNNGTANDLTIFDANNGASVKGIYGNSNTVQPPAVKVYIWKRIG